MAEGMVLAFTAGQTVQDTRDSSKTTNSAAREGSRIKTA